METVVFLDFALFNDEPIGRVLIRLETGLAPRASENYRQLCTGEYRVDRVPVGFKGCVVRGRLAPNSPSLMIESGNFDGRGGTSIYGDVVVFENANSSINGSGSLKHDLPGTVTMLNRGHGSEFAIVTGPAPHLDGQCQVVGRVVAGLPALSKLQAILTDRTVPADSVTISQCGQMY
jgi:peptidyl-prolyl isomerase H (cyclophilin H)